MPIKNVQSVMEAFASKRLSPDQPVIVVIEEPGALWTNYYRPILKGTLAEISKKYPIPQFGPMNCDLSNPMVLCVTKDDMSPTGFSTPQISAMSDVNGQISDTIEPLEDPEEVEK